MGVDEIEQTNDRLIKLIRAWPGEMNGQYCLFDKESGGAAHCQICNMSISHAAIFDWLNHTAVRGEQGCYPALRVIDTDMIGKIRKGADDESWASSQPDFEQRRCGHANW